MYNNNLSTYLSRRNIITAAAVLLFISLIAFIATHGFLIVENIKSDERYTHTSYTNDLSATSSDSRGSFNLLTSGKHSLEIPLADGGIDTKFVTVPRFLTTTTSQKREGENRVETLGRGTLAQLAQTNERLIGWEESGNTQLIESTKLDNTITKQEREVFFPSFEQVVQIDKSWIGGFTRSEDGSITPTYYNFATNDNHTYASFKPGEYVSVQRESQGFSIYDANSQTYRLYRPGQTEVLSTKPEGELVATYDAVPLYSMNPKHTIILTGGDLKSVNENEEVEVEETKLHVRVIQTDNKKIVSDKDLGQAAVNDAIVSPEGTYVYIRTNRSAAIYNTQNLDMVYATPYIINDFLWVDDERFTFTTAEQGLFVGSAKTGGARTVTPYSVIRPTQISFISDGWVYFTAYSRSGEGNENPDVYRASVTATASETDKKVIRSFPHQDDEYYVDYIDGRAVVQLTRYIDDTGSFENEDAKTAASKYISDTFAGKSPEIVYDYIVSDLRPQSIDED